MQNWVICAGSAWLNLGTRVRMPRAGSVGCPGRALSLLVEVPLDVGLEAVEPDGGGPDQMQQWVEERRAWCPDAAEEAEPGPGGVGCRGHAAQQEPALHPAPAGADPHIEPGALPEVP